MVDVTWLVVNTVTTTTTNEVAVSWFNGVEVEAVET